MVNLTELPVERLAPLIQARQISALELTRAFLERIDTFDRTLNTYITVMADQALEDALRADSEIAGGGWRGPLHGIPLGIKDLYDVAGVPNTFGSKILRDNIPKRDATVVSRLRAAGAVVLGKQNMHEFAFGVTCENPHHGDVHNPWDTTRIAGGSSGGTAAAIVAGLCAAGVGSDTGGSVRMPAAMCGLVGLKPTYGRVSRRGILPLAWSLDHPGLLSRTVADAAILLQTIAGPDPDDSTTTGISVPDFTKHLGVGVRGLRLGVPREHFWDVIEPGVASSVRRAIGTLQELGAKVVEVSVPAAVHSPGAFAAIIGGEAASWHETWLRERPGDYGEDILLRLQAGAVTPATWYLKGQRIRALIQHDFESALAQVDAILTPTVPLVAPRIGATHEVNPALGIASRAVINRNTAPFNLTGLPAISIPCGLSEGLPVGLQITGPALQEALVLQIAHAYEQARPWLGLRTGGKG